VRIAECNAIWVYIYHLVRLKTHLRETTFISLQFGEVVFIALKLIALKFSLCFLLLYCDAALDSKQTCSEMPRLNQIKKTVNHLLKENWD